MYSPKIQEDLVPYLYRKAKSQNLPVFQFLAVAFEGVISIAVLTGPAFTYEDFIKSSRCFGYILWDLYGRIRY